MGRLRTRHSILFAVINGDFHLRTRGAVGHQPQVTANQASGRASMPNRLQSSRWKLTVRADYFRVPPPSFPRPPIRFCRSIVSKYTIASDPHNPARERRLRSQDAPWLDVRLEARGVPAAEARFEPRSPECQPRGLAAELGSGPWRRPHLSSRFTPTFPIPGPHNGPAHRRSPAAGCCDLFLL